MKKQFFGAMLVFALAFAMIGLVGCPDNNSSTEEPAGPLSRIRITGIPVGGNDGVTFMMIAAQGGTPGAMGVAVLGGMIGPNEVPAITPDGTAETALYPTMALMTGFLPVAGAGNTVSLPDEITVSGSGRIQVSFTMVSDGENVALPPNARRWEGIVFEDTVEIAWADGE